jgi:cytochrome c553
MRKSSLFVVAVGFFSFFSACGDGTQPRPDSGTTDAGSTTRMDAGMMVMLPTGDATRGMTLYTMNTCQTCHGMNAEGNATGPNISNADAGLASWTQAQFTKALKEGVDPAGKMLCPLMARFTNLSDQDAADIWAWTRTKSSNTPMKGSCP